MKVQDSWASTLWEVVKDGVGPDSEARRARDTLLVRYHETVHHYFKAKVRDPEAAYELYSNFALKLIESDRLVKGADPERGKFRNYLKRVLHNMVADHYRARKQPGTLEGDVAEPIDADPFDPIWRQATLNLAWKALEEQDQETGSQNYAVLRCQSDNPDLDSRELAERLGATLGKSFTADGFRKALERARRKFAELLLEEVERSLESPTPEELEEELVEQRLLVYCKGALARRRQVAP